MPSPQCRTVLRHLYQFLAPLISHPWGCCFHITTLLPATGPATACVCVCALGLGAEGDGRNHRPLPSVPPTHDSTIAAHRHIDTSTAIYAQEDGGSGAAGRRRCAERPWFSTKIPQYGRPGYRRSGRPQQRRTPGACRHVGESPQQKKGGFIGCRQQQLRRGGAHCIGSRCADCRGSCELEHGRREAEIRAQGAGQHAS